jgi:serine/threonine-protein kinase
VPAAVRLLVERALAKDPADRFPDGGAFAEAIRRVAAGGSLTAASTPPAPTTRPTQVLGGFADGRTQVLAATGPGALATAGAAAPATGPGGPMPPLQAPVDDDWDPGGEEPRGERRRGKRWVWLVAALLLLLLLGGGTWLLMSRKSDGSGAVVRTTSASASTSAGPTGILLDPNAFIGHPADQVEAELKAAGLQVTRQNADESVLRDVNEPLDAGDVAGLEPSGIFAAPGTRVVLFVTRNAWTPGRDAETTAPETTTAESTPTPTSSATTTTESSSTTTTPETPTSTAAGSSLTETSATEEPPAAEAPVANTP